MTPHDEQQNRDPAAFMTRAAAAPDAGAPPPPIPTDRPTAARVYGFALGGKDNYDIDRQVAVGTLEHFPEILDIARENRRFLYRAVRHLADVEGIEQFLDLGSGLPTENNVHEVAQAFHPAARVVYVDHDPIAAVHGRALLAIDTATAFIEADMTRPEQILDHEETQGLLDFTRPVGVLMFSIPHCIPDDEAAHRAVRGCIDAAPSGSVLALSHVVADDQATCAETTELITGLGLPWQTRTPAHVKAWLEGLEPISPGLGDINDWHPDPHQPALAPVPEQLQRFEGASHERKRVWEYGGLLRRP